MFQDIDVETLQRQRRQFLTVLREIQGVYPETAHMVVDQEGIPSFRFVVNHELYEADTKKLADIGLRISRQDYKQGSYDNPFKYVIDLVLI